MEKTGKEVYSVSKRVYVNKSRKAVVVLDEDYDFSKMTNRMIMNRVKPLLTNINSDYRIYASDVYGDYVETINFVNNGLDPFIGKLTKEYMKYLYRNSPSFGEAKTMVCSSINKNLYFIIEHFVSPNEKVAQKFKLYMGAYDEIEGLVAPNNNIYSHIEYAYQQEDLYKELISKGLVDIKPEKVISEEFI